MDEIRHWIDADGVSWLGFKVRGELYYINWIGDEIAGVLVHLGNMAADPEMNFNWYDATVVTAYLSKHGVSNGNS